MERCYFSQNTVSWKSSKRCRWQLRHSSALWRGVGLVSSEWINGKFPEGNNIAEVGEGVGGLGWLQQSALVQPDSWKKVCQKRSLFCHWCARLCSKDRMYQPVLQTCVGPKCPLPQRSTKRTKATKSHEMTLVEINDLIMCVARPWWGLPGFSFHFSV